MWHIVCALGLSKLCARSYTHTSIILHPPTHRAIEIHFQMSLSTRSLIWKPSIIQEVACYFMILKLKRLFCLCAVKRAIALCNTIVLRCLYGWSTAKKPIIRKAINIIAFEKDFALKMYGRWSGWDVVKAVAATVAFAETRKDLYIYIYKARIWYAYCFVLICQEISNGLDEYNIPRSLVLLRFNFHRIYIYK